VHASTVADVVVAGYGPAGASAAIAGHDAGAHVIIVESARRGGGNARYSGGFLCDLPVDRAAEHLDAMCFGRTGRTVLAAYADGAALWHMYGCFGWFAFRTPEFAAPFAVDFFAASHIFTDADGRRFADETGYEVHDRLRALLTYLPRNPNRPQLPSWAVFDETTRRAGPLNGLLGTPNDYAWSADNAAEVDRGWILRAGSPGQLAAQMGVDPGVLAGTLEQYNACARAGRDDLFGRSADTLVPLDLSRLYAIPTWPGIAGTTGGPRHDERARVLRPDGRPVPGLYAAGAVSLVWGHLIEHGGGLTDALVFGRIAGAQAAARAAQEVVSPVAGA
jgi:succinate dehydrogenase/fumarate reductase flavoprotein subunit